MDNYENLILRLDKIFNAITLLAVSYFVLYVFPVAFSKFFLGSIF